ncbi:4Fe-4S dicluster domain-containing protein [Candidatus Leptofilum sp.]|uniref:4Fe-4S dicluster domain-containing protein n=1 Tax=Candidatus Leptofilum sp. TaxID=3241576 RepID=UPI003B5B3A3D
MGIIWGKETEDGYAPSWWHRRMKPAITGNEINGLGEKEKRRPTPVYHRQDWWHPWRWVQEAFYGRIALYMPAFMCFIKSNILDAREPVPIAAKPVPGTPHEWTERIRQKAEALGVSDVRVVRITEDLIFDRDTIPEKYAIILASQMRYEKIHKSTERKFRPSLLEAMQVYLQGNVKAKKLANWLREQGYDARGFGTPMGTPLNIVHAAQRGGMGQLGKHGSLIHAEFGPMFRMAYVLTDLPLIVDEPVDIAVDDFCKLCQLCTKACPPGAIFNEKQWVRGELKWYVDFDKCVPYFNENMGCGICLAVCPYGQPGVSETLIDKMLRRRERDSQLAG